MSASLTYYWLFLFVLVILLVVMRAFVASLIFEKQTVDVLSAPSQWAPQVISLPNSVCALTGTISRWPPENEKCMLEGINRYMTEYQRTCAEEQGCIDFNGDKVNGNSTFFGMCSDFYCGMSQCSITFSDSTSSYVTVTGTGGEDVLDLQQGPFGTPFMMRRMSFNSSGDLVANMNGIFAIFVYYDEGSDSQYILCYDNHYTVTDSATKVTSFVTKLELRKTQQFDFPNATATNQNNYRLSLFILVDTLSRDLINASGPSRTMRRKIVCINNRSASSDSILMTQQPYLSALQAINGKNPPNVFSQGLGAIGCGIFNWYTAAESSTLTGLTDGFYSINTDYVTVMNTISQEADRLRGVTQDIVEFRLSPPGGATLQGVNLPFYSWSVG